MSAETWRVRLATIIEMAANNERTWWRRQVFHKAGPYRPTTPKFHIFRKRYQIDGSASVRWVALCGYGYGFREEVEYPYTRLTDPPKGTQCAKCLKAAEKV